MKKNLPMNKCVILTSNFETAVPHGITDAQIVSRMREERMGDGFCCWLDHMHGKQTPPEILDSEHQVVTFWPNNPYNAIRAKQRGVTVDEYNEWAFELIRKRCREVGERFLWCIGWETFHPAHWCLEDGSPPRFADRQEAFAFHQRWVRTRLQTLHWRNSLKFGEDRHNRRPSALEWIAEKRADPATCNLMLGSVLASHAHYAFETVPEAKTFWWECAISLMNLQVGFPFVRGAAKQYGRRWLVDVSPFCYPHPIQLEEHYKDLGEWGDLEGKVRGLSLPRMNFPKYTADMVRLAGWTPEMLARCWFAALMSGADYVYEEAASVTHLARSGDRLATTPVGERSARLADFNRRVEDRGRTQTPVALVLDFHHGVEPWMPESKKPWCHFEPGDGDAQIKGFFEVAYPGHSEWPGEHPWRNPREYGEMLRSGYDFRPHERRILCAGRWPDMFDVYLSNAPAAAFADAKAIVLLGEQRADGVRQAALRKLVEEGRSLVVGVEQLAGGGGLLGEIMIEAETREGWAVVEASTGVTTQERSFVFRVVRVSSEWETVLMTPEGRPLLLRRTFGRGEVWIWTVLFGLDTFGKPLDSWVASLNRLFAPLVPFEFDGPPLQRIINRTERGWLVAMLNHAAQPWHGTVRCRGVSPKEVRERWLEQSAVWWKTPDGASIRATIPPFSFRAYEVLTVAS
ncbi:MAG: hypothetical protein IT578_00125 [Verrucomicrobiae bacterium]|nr:hypothetical protein [Verrucomicrobiae bacterium]